MPFGLFVSLERRRMILNSIMGDDSDPQSSAVKEKGERILNNYKK